MTASATERAADYHADRGDRPTLSSSIAATLTLKTPAHAWAEHPKLNPGYVDKHSDAMDMGTAVHQLLLRDERVQVGAFPDYRTADAQAWRDMTREHGLVPLLTHQWERATMIADAIRKQMDGLNVDPVPFTRGTAEHVIRFTYNDVECRAMLDWLSDDCAVIDDLKTTTDASPRKVERHLFNMGYDTRAAFYVRAVEAEYGGTPVFRWVFAETSPPYPVSIFTLDDDAWREAFAKVDRAVELWRACLATDTWPAYPPDLNVVELPRWLRTDAWAAVDVDESVPF